jgi:hypothetical protein
MSRLRTDAIAPVSFWAVAKLSGATQVAIKFDDHPPILMSVEDAREFAAALSAELGDEHAPAVPPLLKLA